MADMNNKFRHKIMSFSFFIVVCSIPLLDSLINHNYTLQIILGATATFSLSLIFSFNYGLVFRRIKRLDTLMISFILISCLFAYVAWVELTTKALNLSDEDAVINLIYNNELLKLVIFAFSIYFASQCLSILIHRIPWRKTLDDSQSKTDPYTPSMYWGEDIEKLLQITENRMIIEKSNQAKLKSFLDKEIEKEIAIILEKHMRLFYNPENHVPVVIERVTIELLKRMKKYQWPQVKKDLMDYLNLNFRKFVFENLIENFVKHISEIVEGKETTSGIHPRSLMIFLLYLQQSEQESNDHDVTQSSLIKNSPLKHLLSDDSKPKPLIKDVRGKRKLVLINLLIYIKYKQYKRQSDYLDNISLVKSMKRLDPKIDTLVKDFNRKMVWKIGTKYLDFKGWKEVNTTDKVSLQKSDDFDKLVNLGLNYFNSVENRLLLIDVQNNDNESLSSNAIYSEFMDLLKAYIELV